MNAWQCLSITALVCALGMAQSHAQETSPQATTQATNEDSARSAVVAVADIRLEASPRVSPEALFEKVTELAQEKASSEYQQPQSPLPESLANLDYSTYQDIHFRKDSALWSNEGLFEVQFFHLGFLYDTPVDIRVLENGRIEDVNFEMGMFDYGKKAARVRDELANMDQRKLGFAGLRLHYPLNTPHRKDEFLVYLGASYFRVAGRGQGYGISARGLAVNTATQGGEEFPAFRSFWLVEPESESATVTLLALLDSPSVAGAYRFDIDVANNIVINVDSHLFARNDVPKLGVAPLTSMFLHGENSFNRHDDFRPEVHDSDGLLMLTSGNQWIWRPLSNPQTLNVTQLRDTSPLGFGLMQRDREFDSYLDMSANFQRRPSLWVEPREGDWKEGGVELVEIPVDSSVNDNIVAYWVPDEEFRAGDERRYQYRLSTYGKHLPEQELGRVIRTRQGWSANAKDAEPAPRTLRRFVVDFRGGNELASLNGSQPVEAELTVARGKVSDLEVTQLPDGRTWRASFKLAPQNKASSDMQLKLKLRGRTLTETWSYIWNPNVVQ
ncbi:glucan biosynthesis protein [Halomonas sp. M20]|uniref:glucan biosynthesis protein n=1 Tax=Halomonas sp. M20 TaxID=2763264 RepID=UPI001D0A1CB5|nr:glucan biosynthesis protein [Halomonas sp. M20]